MTEQQPPSTRFWTWDMLALLGVNIVFIGFIIVGLWLILGSLATPIMSWLEHIFGV